MSLTSEKCDLVRRSVVELDFAEARRLIENYGYGRRKEELKDAEEAAKSWPGNSTMVIP